MATVDSVQTVSIALDATETTDSTALAALTLANAVPFATLETDISSSNWHKRQADIELASGADRVVVTRDSASATMTVSAAVVEFNPTATTVQSGTFTIATSAATGTVAITEVVLANTFLVCYPLGDDAIPNESMARGFFSSPSELTFERGASPGDKIVIGHWFVVEADGGQFDVQSWSIAMSGSTSNTASLDAVTMADTMLVCSAHTESGDRAANLNGLRVRLSGTATVTADRDTSEVVVYTISGFSIEFAGAEDVQRGVHTWAASDGDQTTTITEVDADLSIAWNPHPHHGTTTDEADQTSARECWSAATFDDPTTIKQARGTTQGAGSAGWETIEFELVTAGGPAPFLPVLIRRNKLNPLLVR